MNYTKLHQRLFLLFSFFIFSISILDAQSKWQRRFDMGDDEQIGNATITPDGGYVMTGSTGASGSRNVFVIKTDTEGNEQWSQIYDLPAASSFGKKVRNTPDGGYVVFASNYAGDPRLSILKLDALGNEQWQQSYIDAETYGGVGDLIVTADGGYAFLSSKFILDDLGEITNRENYLYRLDYLGNVLWIHESGTETDDFANSLIENPDGSFVFTGGHSDALPLTYNCSLTKVDALGNEIWSQHYNDFPLESGESGNSVVATSDGGYLIGGNKSGGNIWGPYVVKTDHLGNIVWTKILGAEPDHYHAMAVIQTLDENYIIYSVRDHTNIHIFKLSPTGDVIWEKEIQGLRVGLSIEETDDLGLVITGKWTDQNSGIEPDKNIALIKMDKDGIYYPKVIVGNVFTDVNASCSFDDDEMELNDILVQANASDGTMFYTNTDSDGNYFMGLDTGDYVLTSYINTTYMQPCQAEYAVTLSNPLVFDSTTVDMPIEVTAICPYLTVGISSFALRECFDNIYYVDYCNNGTLDANAAYVELSLQEPLFITTASIPFTGPDSNNVYTLDVGDIGMGECGGFNVNVQLPCDSLNVGSFLGKTFCVDAHIYPDSICGSVSDLWDGSSIEVAAECDQDSVRFRIRNIGEGDMQQSRQFYVIEDQIMFMQGDFQLLSGESRNVAFFASGGTFRLEAEQAENHPGESNPSVALEGCGGEFPLSVGFINQYPQDDGDPFIDSECREATASYDPNDKQGFPIGYGEEHYIENGRELEYLIRFQNTGTDTAFTVVIRDEISGLFDLSSIQLGASSHTYDFQVVDRMVKFTFNNIFLVDSLTNEAESHGFIKFRIDPIEDLPIGTVLENTANIYFDFNTPIITNTTFHTIGENFVTVDLISSNQENEVSNYKIKAYPNPFIDEISFELEGNLKDVVFIVYDISGKALHQQNVNSNIFQFNGEGIANGIYFYTIQSEGTSIAKGKIMLMK